MTLDTLPPPSPFLLALTEALSGYPQIQNLLIHLLNPKNPVNCHSFTYQIVNSLTTGEQLITSQDMEEWLKSMQPLQSREMNGPCIVAVYGDETFKLLHTGLCIPIKTGGSLEYYILHRDGVEEVFGVEPMDPYLSTLSIESINTRKEPIRATYYKLPSGEA